MSVPAARTWPFLAAALAGLTAPWLLGASWSASMAAAAVVCLVAGGISLGLEGRRAGLPGMVPLSAGLVVLAIGPGAILSARIPGAVAGAAVLGGAGLACASLMLVTDDWRKRGEELATLRSRLARREGDVRAQADRIRRLDLIDPVTGLFNRRGFSGEVERALAAAADDQQPVALLLIELSQPLPDVGGPDPESRGRRVGQAVGRAVRGSDVAGRWDENLLALLLPSCPAPQPALERLRSSLVSVGLGEASGTRLAGLTISEKGPWPDAEGLMAAAQAARSSARFGIELAEVPVWPIDWGLASLNRTHPTPVPS